MDMDMDMDMARIDQEQGGSSKEQTQTETSPLECSRDKKNESVVEGWRSRRRSKQDDDERSIENSRAWSG